jgi:hypothetical protein
MATACVECAPAMNVRMPWLSRASFTAPMTDAYQNALHLAAPAAAFLIDPSPHCAVCCSLWLLLGMDGQNLEEVHPDQWTEVSPGSFSYRHMFSNSAQHSVYLAVDSTQVN